MRIIVAALLVLLIALQARLWLSDDGYPAVAALNRATDHQLAENEVLRERNSKLAAEVSDLREGFSALEERARADLGLIAPGESFYLLAEPAPETVDPDSGD